MEVVQPVSLGTIEIANGRTGYEPMSLDNPAPPIPIADLPGTNPCDINRAIQIAANLMFDHGQNVRVVNDSGKVVFPIPTYT